MATIFHQVIIEAGKQTIFNAIASQVGQASWWIADCTVKPEVGFVNEFRVEGHGTNKMKVVALRPGEAVEWECVNDDDEWTSTRISFEITEQENGCALSFKQSGWKEANDFYATCNYHWARHLWMLARYCETGIAQLDDDVERQEVRKVLGD